MINTRRDPDFSKAVMDFAQADPDNYLRLEGLADFFIKEDGQNPFELVEPILTAGAKVGFVIGHDLFEADDGSTTYYFAGRKGELLKRIQDLTA